jgi:hypothetical protein
MRGRVGEQDVRYRVFCAVCHKNSYMDYPLPYGVRRFKTGRCSNTDSRLGFPCVINWDLVESTGFKLSTEVDHKNGRNTDNRTSNLQELCAICHKEKGKQAGDHDSWKHYRTA